LWDEGDWVVEDKFDPVWAERKKGQGVIEITRDAKPGALTEIDSVFYQNTYPITAVVYGLYRLRDPDPANLAPLRDGNLNCVAQRVVDHFEGALKGQGLSPARRQKIREWEERVHTSLDPRSMMWLNWKRFSRAIIIQDIADEVELIYHNGHAWSTKVFPGPYPHVL